MAIAEITQVSSYQPMLEKTLPKSCGFTACMIAPDDCQSHLQEICRHYEQWWTKNALTKEIADQQATFSFEQMVQTEEEILKTSEVKEAKESAEQKAQTN